MFFFVRRRNHINRPGEDFHDHKVVHCQPGSEDDVSLKQRTNERTNELYNIYFLHLYID